MEKKLVAYFSATGTTKRLAEKLANAVHADLFEIIPEIPYTAADLNWHNSASRSSVEMNNPASRPGIAIRCTDMDEYNIIYIGFPIWWYVAPTIINTFLEAYSLKGKTIIPFATSGGSGIGNTGKALAPSCKGANLKNGKVFPVTVSEKELADWAHQF